MFECRSCGTDHALLLSLNREAMMLSLHTECQSTGGLSTPYLRPLLNFDLNSFRLLNIMTLTSMVQLKTPGQMIAFEHALHTDSWTNVATALSRAWALNLQRAPTTDIAADHQQTQLAWMPQTILAGMASSANHEHELF